MALLLHCLTLPSRALACVVGTGIGPSCTESALTACLPGGGSFDGTVTFSCGGTVTITITSTKTISADTTMDGGSRTTVSGGNSVSVFSVNAGVTFTVQNLTIADGMSATGTNGGGIVNSGTLTVTNSTFSGNNANGGLASGGGIVNSGTLTVTNSTFSGNSATYGAGAILHVGGSALTVTNSTFSGNSAVYGGALSTVAAPLTVTNSTFSGNSAAGDGGGIASDSSVVTVTNSTFSGNSAAYVGGSLWTYGGGSLTVTNSIVANSTGGNCNGVITDGGHNIDDGTACGFTGTGCTSTSGSSFCGTNPQLDPTGLQNNGGQTQTMALCTGIGAPSGCTGASPGINAGDESVCSSTTGTAPVDNLDQRGFVRPGTGATNCSIGAYEANSAPGLASCAPIPRGICSAPIKAALKLQGNAEPTKQKVQWKWSGTAAVGAFGIPTGTTDYALCVYDDGALVMRPAIAASGMCGTNPCWTVSSKGQLKYKNKAGNADGITGVTLQPNAAAGKAKILVKGKGASLTLPLPLTDTTNVTVQLVSYDVMNPESGTACWQAVFPAPAKKTGPLLFQDQIP